MAPKHGGCTPVNHRSSVGAKIALFRSLFRGRDDVYPRRFESRKTGKSGYQPACANEWIKGLCEKPRVKCAECPGRRLLPITDEVIRWHLAGQDDHGRDFVMGVYPMLLDETCFFLAVDFDKISWCDDVGAFLETCRNMDLPATLERSRSSNGGHVWLFFDEAIPAGLARKLGSHILTETMYHRRRRRIEAHVLVAFVAYAIYKELERRLGEAELPLSTKRAVELTQTMYEIAFTLPNDPQQQRTLLKMDPEQQALYGLFY